MAEPLHTLTIDEPAAAFGPVRAALRAAIDGAGPPFLPLPPEPTAAAALLGVARPDQPFGDTALLVPTSGSTGTPKLVELSAAAVIASARATEVALGGPGQWLLALPMTHIAGLQVVVRSILAGTDPVVHPATSFTVGSFVAATDELTATRRYTALVPTQLRRLLDTDEGVTALRRYDAVLVGGAATPPPLLTAARRAGAAVVTTYGMSETSGGCLYNGRPVGGAGFVLDAAGRIRLTGPTLARGYRGEPALTAAVFGPDGFLTSDLGRVGADGALQILGRADDVIITGGVNVHPLAVEAVIARVPGVIDVCVAGVPDTEWGSAVTAWVVGAAATDAIRDAVRRELGGPAAPRAVHRVDAIPLLVSGKPDRRRLVRSTTVDLSRESTVDDQAAGLLDPPQVGHHLDRGDAR